MDGRLSVEERLKILSARILEGQKMLQTGQVLFWRLSVKFALVLPFKDSQGGTSSLELTDFKRNSLRRHAPVEKANAVC